MDSGAIAPLQALDAATAAWAQAIASASEAPAVVEGSPLLAHEGLTERMLGSEAPAGPGEPEAAPGARTDLGGKTATVQTFARVQAPAAEAAPRDEKALPAARNALSEFALPAAQLVPSTLAGLQVEPAHGWPLHRQAADAPSNSEAAPQPRAPSIDDDATGHNDEAEAHEETEPPATPDVALADPADEGCETLVRALQAALAAAIRPSALCAAAEQWQRGRCVVLACPQGDDVAGAASAFVLWPCRAARHGPVPLALRGQRVDARLHWREPPRGARWCHARLMKEHHPRHGRQLVAIDDAGVPVGCEVQLGPVVMEHRRPCEVAVRIDAVRRFWTALGAQWSVHVVVCSLPLAGRAAEETPC